MVSYSKDKTDTDVEKQYWSGEVIKDLPDNGILVFGSNAEGRHGAGLAKVARVSYGAVYGRSRGLQGKSYGLVTKNLTKGFTEKLTGITYDKEGYRSVTPKQIINNIKELYECCRVNEDKLFYMPYKFTSNKSLNGYTGVEMFTLFMFVKNVPNNIVFHESYK